jgi:hypothetical protein
VRNPSLTPKDCGSFWDAVWYKVVYLLGTLQTLICDHVIKEPVWRSFNGRVTLIKDMEDRHLTNCIMMLQRNGDRSSPMFGRMLREAYKRGIHV